MCRHEIIRSLWTREQPNCCWRGDEYHTQGAHRETLRWCKRWMGKHPGIKPRHQKYQDSVLPSLTHWWASKASNIVAQNVLTHTFKHDCHLLGLHSRRIICACPRREWLPGSHDGLRWLKGKHVTPISFVAVQTIDYNRPKFVSNINSVPFSSSL